MANEEVVMTIKAEITPAKKQVENFTQSIDNAKDAQKELNEQISIQNQVLNQMEKELVELKSTQDAIPKGAFYAGMDDLNKKIKETEKNIKLEKLGLKDLQNQQKDNNNELKEQAKALKETNKAAKDTIGNFKVMGVSLNGIKASVGKVIPLVKTMFGTIKAGILSTGIGALLIAFGSLATYFTSTQRGADKLKVVLTGLGAAFNVIRDRISSVGEAASLFFSGKFSEAVDKLKGSFTGLGDEIKKEVALMTALEKRTQALRDAEIQFTVQRAETRKEIEKARLLAEDETQTQEVRIEALKKALKLEQETTNQELELARERVRIQEEQMAVSENLVEDEKKLADFRADVINKETKSFRLQKRVKTEINELERELIAEKEKKAKEEQAIIDEKAKTEQEQIELEAQAKLEAFAKLKALEDENFLASIENEKERALALLEQQYDAELASLSQYENFLELKEQLDIKYANAKEALDTKQKEWEEYTTNERLGLASDAFGQMSEIMGKETKAGQAAAVVQAGISTYLGAQEAYTSMAKIPVVGPVLGGIAAAAAVAMGLKNIQAIKSGGKSPGGASSSSVPSLTSATPAPEMLSGRFELTPPTEQQPVQAYVVTDNLTDNQNKLAYIRRRATI